MANPAIGNVGNVRDVIGQFKQGAWIPVPVTVTLADLDDGATIVAGDLDWVCPFEEAYVAAVSLGNGGAGSGTLTLDLKNNAGTSLLDAAADGTGEAQDIAADLSTPAEFEVDDGTIVTTADAHKVTRGQVLTFSIASTMGTHAGLVAAVTLMVPVQALDESTPGQNYRFD